MIKKIAILSIFILLPVFSYGAELLNVAIPGDNTLYYLSTPTNKGTISFDLETPTTGHIRFYIQDTNYSTTHLDICIEDDGEFRINSSGCGTLIFDSYTGLQHIDIVFDTGTATIFRDYVETPIATFNYTGTGTMNRALFDLTEVGQVTNFLISDTTVDSLETHLIAIAPIEDAVVGNEVTFEYEIYVNPNDIGTYIGLGMTLENIDLNAVFQSDNSEVFMDNIQATTTGYSKYTFTKTLDDGGYRVDGYLDRTYLGGFIQNPFSPINEHMTHFFTVNNETWLSNLRKNASQDIADIIAGTTATSTDVTATVCSPVSGNISTAFLNPDFDVVLCSFFLFVPDDTRTATHLENMKTNVLNRFPIGYVTDFTNIIATTSTTTLTIIDAKVPPGIPGTGAEISLDISHVLDPILNATVGDFANESATDTRTLFEITYDYWKIIVYIMTIFYIVGRVLGSRLIPKIN